MLTKETLEWEARVCREARRRLFVFEHFCEAWEDMIFWDADFEFLDMAPVSVLAELPMGIFGDQVDDIYEVPEDWQTSRAFHFLTESEGHNYHLRNPVE